MKERLRKFLIQEGITPSQFADEIGVQRSAISHILSGRNYPSYDIIVKILNRYKRLSPDWLLLGTGNLYRPDPSAIPSNIETTDNSDISSSETFDQNRQNNLLNLDHANYPSAKKQNGSQNLSTSVNKSISSIIILYSDRSFEIYHQQD